MSRFKPGSHQAFAAFIADHKERKKKRQDRPSAYDKLATRRRTRHGMGPSGLGLVHGCGGLTHGYAEGSFEGNDHEFIEEDGEE